MRCRSSSSRISKMENNKEVPHLSGAYIRTLVKHLTTSTKTKSPKTLNTNGKDCSDDNNIITQKQSPPQQPQHKKQVRRRQHTSRPYQERLLNMAEARREIVTALKFHRASMKQQQQTPTVAATNAYYWPISTVPPLLNQENLDFTLPNQTLGLNLNLNLNLNFQDFKNLNTNFSNNPLSINSSSSSSSSSSPSSSSSSPSSSSSAAISVATEELAAGLAAASSSSGTDLHHAMDDEEMQEIRSLGEQHQMEWNDTVNLMTSARWFKFLKTMEKGVDNQKDDESNTFDQVMEFPSWLINANESSFSLEQYSDDYLQYPALPCMDMGEIEGMYEEWLA